MHSVEEVSDLIIPVTLKRDFDNLFPGDPIERISAAASDIVERQIFINQMPFSQLEHEAAGATLAHEIG